LISIIHGRIAWSNTKSVPKSWKEPFIGGSSLQESASKMREERFLTSGYVSEYRYHSCHGPDRSRVIWHPHSLLVAVQGLNNIHLIMVLKY
jgi:hypothetical protein